MSESWRPKKLSALSKNPLLPCENRFIAYIYQLSQIKDMKKWQANKPYNAVKESCFAETSVFNTVKMLQIESYSMG